MVEPTDGGQEDLLRGDEGHLAGLGEIFLQAMDFRRKGDVDRASDLLRIILRREPRLPEPHLELAHIFLEMNRLDEAESEGREALRLLLAGGQWIEDIAEDVLKSLAHALVGEVLRRRTEQDEVVFGDPEAFRSLLAQSRKHFAEASRLDPENDHAGYHDFFLGLEEENGATEG